MQPKIIEQAKIQPDSLFQAATDGTKLLPNDQICP